MRSSAQRRICRRSRCRALDGRSDIFSFGSVLYELLSGKRAFAGESSGEVLSAVLRDTPRPLAASPLSRIASRCLEKDPSHRYQTMAEVRAALEDMTRAQPEAEASIAVLPFENLVFGSTAPHRWNRAAILVWIFPNMVKTFPFGT